MSAPIDTTPVDTAATDTTVAAVPTTEVPTCENTHPAGTFCGPINGPADVGTPTPIVHVDDDECLDSHDPFNPGRGTTSRSLQVCYVPVVVEPRQHTTTVGVADRSLPVTGSTSTPMVGSAGLALVVGVCLARVARRRSA